MIAVWFSCGAASAVAAKKTIEKYGSTSEVRVINNPIANEHSDNQRFLADCEKWLGTTIESCTNPKYPSTDIRDVFRAVNWMGDRNGAPCTSLLKIKARQIWESENKPEHTVLGFTYDEIDRHESFCKSQKPILPVLIDAKITKGDCFRIIKDAGIELPEIYKLGYPNANCIGCVKATSPTYWNHVRKMHPLVFEERAIQSREIGAKLVRVKNDRIFLDELDPMARGNKMKDMNFECGIFCEY